MKKEELIIENMKAFVGKEVLLLEGHEFAGQKGTTLFPQLINGNPEMVIELRDGNRTHAANKHIMFIMATIMIDPKRQN